MRSGVRGRRARAWPLRDHVLAGRLARARLLLQSARPALASRAHTAICVGAERRDMEAGRPRIGTWAHREQR